MRSTIWSLSSVINTSLVTQNVIVSELKVYYKENKTSLTSLTCPKKEFLLSPPHCTLLTEVKL